MTEARRLLLHVGQTKAGSTSIQNYLEAESELLLAEGVLFPLSVFERKNPFDQRRTAGHLKFVKMLEAGALEEFEVELARHPGHRLMLTIENLFSDRPDKTLAQIGAYFQGWEIHLIAVLRPQFDWLRSRYVEYVLSGFNSRDMSFSQFISEVQQSDVLDYAGRLQRLGEIFGAQSIRAIPFDEDGSLIIRFLKAAGLPVTNPKSAISIRDNVREKAEFLVEAKRRLNSLTTQLRWDAQLELEHCLRSEAARMMAVDPALATPSALAVPLNAEELIALKASNLSLTDMAGLDRPLPIGDPADASVPQEAGVTKAIEVLFLKGLEIAAGLAKAQRRADPTTSADFVLDLAPEELAALITALAHHPVSLHVDSPSTAILAASLGGRMAILALQRGSSSYQIMSRLDRLVTASPLLPLDIPRNGDWTVEMLESLLSRLDLPRPGVVVLGSEAKLSFTDAVSHWQKEQILTVAISDVPTVDSPAEERRTNRLWVCAIDTPASTRPDREPLLSRSIQDA